MQPPTYSDLKLGSLLRVDSGSNDNASPLPLSYTAVNGLITGPIASVSVTQTFSNPFTDVIELAYLFPLPHEAAVFDYEIQIGSRRIRADMKELEAARQAYQDAIDAGQRASLLEQRRPNLFSVQIGNVQPGETITATLRYQERLRYADDGYTFVFPMGVTPKYHADPSQSAQVDSPLAGADQKIGGVSLTLSVDAGVTVGDAVSPSHAIQIARQDERRFTVTVPVDTIPNKDFVLRYPVATDTVQSAAWVSADADADTVLITLLPPRLTADAAPDPREFVFVIDRSGSMQGSPIEQAKNALRACLRAMGSQDTFTIQAFDDAIEWFMPKAQSVTQETVNRADQWLNGVDARGGTEIVPAISAALSLPVDPERQRYVVFLTDGAVSAEEQAQAMVKKLRGTTRLFTFGIGPSVNRALLTKMAEYGRGTAEFLQLDEDIETAITRFQDRVSYPALQDLTLNWQGAEVWDVYPAALPDLYVGQPLELVARLKRVNPSASQSATQLSVTGKRRDQAITLMAAIPVASGSDPALKRVWARARVDALLAQPLSDTIRQQVISLAIDQRLVTPYTAFVAIDSEAINASGTTSRKVNVSVPLPEGLDLSGFVGNFGGGGLGAASSGAMPASMMRSRGVTAAAPMAMPPSPMTPDQGIISRKANINPLQRLLRKEQQPAPSPQQASQSPTPKPGDNALLSSIPERIKWLARTQNVSGSWGSGADEGERTAAALLAFVRAGHTTRVGSYRAQVRKAADWLKVAKLTGFATFACWRALRELDAATQAATQNGDTFASAALQPGTPTSNPEHAALGNPSDPALTPPDKITSLDALRSAALLSGAVAATDELLADSAQSDLVQTWLAVGKPVA